MSDYDVAVVGGGMVGASLALALAQARINVALIEAHAPGSRTQPSFDDRTTALGNSSRKIFTALGAWPRIEDDSGFIRAIHVSDAGRFGFARLNAKEQGVEAFGYVAPNRVIGAALWEQIDAHSSHITQHVPAQVQALQLGAEQVSIELRGNAQPLTARLVVAADGAHSVVREAAGIPASVEDYHQVAIVANVETDEPHDETAYERFTPSGPMALLPLHDGTYTIVWTLTPEHAARTLTLSDLQFLENLQACFGWRAGKFVRVGKRASYPLQLTRATAAAGVRSVLIGNAAQALHPVAGQGFNLGLRDAAMLAELIAAAGADPGAADVLEKFKRWREADRRGVIRFTDGLVKLFGDTRPGMGVLRNFGLLLFDLAPPAKSALARVSTGFAGPSPRLARGLTLQ